MWNKIRIAAGVLLFALCIVLVVIGQKHIGWGGLCAMLAGLAGLLLLLFAYNRSYR